MLSSFLDQRCLGIQSRCQRGSLPLKKRKVSLEDLSASHNGSSSSHPHDKEDSRRLLSQIALNGSDLKLSHGICSSLKENSNIGMAALSLVATAAASVYSVSTSSSSLGTLGQQRHNDVGGIDAIVEKSHLDTNRNDGNLSYALGQDMLHNSFESTSAAPYPTLGGHETNKKQKVLSTTQQTHQDKRYTGAQGEVRCSATTTRGRACAYTCVSGTRYCYLHSDYDVNPPPRRWSHKGKAEASVCNSSNSDAMVPFVVGESGETSLKGLERLPAALLVPNSSPSVTSEDMSRLPSPFVPSATDKFQNTKRSRRTTSTKLAAKHADSPFPLLSMISTDQWYHKLVKIATGHLAGRIGKVEKWGNGWVSVDVPGVGLHNRRSFELYLDNETSEVECPESPRKADEHENNRALFRCISQEISSPLSNFCPATKIAATKAEIDNYSSGSNRETPHFFESVPPSDVAEKLRPFFGRSNRHELSPFYSRGIAEINHAPKVTPLPARETHSCDHQILFEPGLHIPETGSLKGPSSIKHKREFRELNER